jgi:ACS family tartrate transporter-like MFS transporter
MSPDSSALDRARRKAYIRLIPLLFVCYVIAYIDRVNIAYAKLTMSKDMPEFTNEVIGFGAGLFFLGYFLLEIPGSIIVEKWSARKWIARIMISWGIIAALNAFVTTPMQFYVIRFLLGLAEAGFFPGVIVFLSHWFPQQDRARAFAMFLMATPIAQVISPTLCNPLLKIGMKEVVDGVEVVHPLFLGFTGWQWIFIAWGIPACILGLVVLYYLTDWPREAKWLADDERQALEAELENERQAKKATSKHLTLAEALRHPKVLILAAAYFCVVTCNYGIEFFLPSILKDWYNLKLDTLTVMLVLPPIGALAGQYFVGWNSDRTKERRLHTAVPIAMGAIALAISPLTIGLLPVTVALIIVARTGVKAYQPAFWTLPGMFLTSTAAAGSIGFINSIGNLGGFVGPTLMGKLQTMTGSFTNGILVLAGMMVLSSLVILMLGMGKAPATEAK